MHDRSIQNKEIFSVLGSPLNKNSWEVCVRKEEDGRISFTPRISHVGT